MSSLIDLRDFCCGERESVPDTTEALVRLESPTTDKAAVDRCGAELATRLEAIGGRVTRLPQRDRGDHIRAEFSVGPANSLREGDGGQEAGPHVPQVLLLGHFDTVWPVGTLARMPVVHTDGRLHGPG